jgi:RNA polymerase sigma-70 factor (ECF subfamily)
MVDGPESGLRSLDILQSDPAMRGYYLYPAVRADFLRRLGRTAEAAASYRLALARPCAGPERRFLELRLKQMSEPGVL